MREPLLIYGAGGLGREVLSLVNATDMYEVKGFLDDGMARGTSVKGVKVLGGYAEIQFVRSTHKSGIGYWQSVVEARVAEEAGSIEGEFPNTAASVSNSSGSVCD